MSFVQKILQTVIGLKVSIFSSLIIASAISNFYVRFMARYDL